MLGVLNRGAHNARVKLLDQVRRKLRAGHYAYRTEQAYVHWSVRFIRWHGVRHPREMGAAEVEAFLAHLAVDRHVLKRTSIPCRQNSQPRPPLRE